MHDPCTDHAVMVGCPIPPAFDAFPAIAIAIVIVAIVALAIRRFA